MKINSAYFLFMVYIGFVQTSCTHKEMRIEKTVTLEHYPSGSGMAVYNDTIYMVGDDATKLLMLDSDFNIVDSIVISASSETRIPKPLKHDYESATIVNINKEKYLLLNGSGSLPPFRNFISLISLNNNIIFNYDVSDFYQRIKAEGIAQINIEGAAAFPGGIILANRGNKSFRKNHLIFTSNEFWDHIDSAEIHIMIAGVNENDFSGISGLEYSAQSDKLLLTVSTEETFTTHGDGSIGKSYLWIINDISAKKRRAAINPDRVIDLEAVDERFRGNKIESVCILSENRKEMQLALVADNDTGNSILFKVVLQK